MVHVSSFAKKSLIGTAQFKIWHILKLATHFKTGQPILKPAGPFLLCTFYLAHFKADQTAHFIKMGSLFQNGQPACFEMGQPVSK